METLAQVTSKLYVYFDLLNSRYFNDELITPIITVQKDVGKKNSTCYGWFSVNRIWKDKDQTYHEINIVADSLNRPIEATIGTLLHEMNHMYCSQKGIADTSGASNQYHNKDFKKTAETHGLLISKNKYGWSETTINDETAEFLKSINAEPFELFREREFKMPSTPKPRESHTYICKGCENKVKSSTEMDLHCNECDLDLEEDI